MEDRKASFVKCPYCDFEITRLSFRMIEVSEERYSAEEIGRMKEKLAQLRGELREGTEMDTPHKVLYRNKIERIEADLEKPVRAYRERVYCCPSCDRVLTIVPSNEISAIIEAVHDVAFDIRKIK